MACCNCCCESGKRCCRAQGENGICCEPSKCCGTNAAPFCCGTNQKCCGTYCCETTSTCCGGSCCPPDRQCCNGICCPQGQSCINGACSPCPQGQSLCGSACCPDDRTCCSGTCCPAGQVCCDGVCQEAPCGPCCCPLNGPFEVVGNLSEDTKTYSGVSKIAGFYSSFADGPITIGFWPLFGYTFKEGIDNTTTFNGCGMHFVTDSAVSMVATDSIFDLFRNPSVKWRHRIRVVAANGCDGEWTDVTEQVLEPFDIGEGQLGYERFIFSDFGHEVPEPPDFLPDDKLFLCEQAPPP